MGLGKTLQCIALVWTLLKQNPWGGGGVVKRVLVVAPSSLTANWGKEFHKWLGKERLQVYVVDNNNKVEDFFRQQWSSVLVVSYDQLLRSQDQLCRPSNGFGLVICDEGHRLKNPTSKTSAALAALPIARRVLLTGTPVQNDLQVSGVLVSWCLTDTPVQNCFRFGNERVKELNRITSQFILRRTQAIINKYLPPKVECVVFCQPSASQEAVYSSVAGLVSRMALAACAGVDHLSAIILLRKIANHPSLLNKGNR
ncbi:SNF2-related N-terminal domain [Trinorchestia longiramus]|nr:SNF2-related N-terminal domain [Trinorchestia longiramus]